MTKKLEKVSDWDSIYNKIFQKRAVARFNYDCTHGIGAYDRNEKAKLEELHQFFVKLEKESDDNARRTVIYI